MIFLKFKMTPTPWKIPYPGLLSNTLRTLFYSLPSAQCTLHTAPTHPSQPSPPYNTATEARILVVVFFVIIVIAIMFVLVVV